MNEKEKESRPGGPTPERQKTENTGLHKQYNTRQRPAQGGRTGNLFQAVREGVTTLMAAARYGIHADAAGMARCPFHDDREPSLKLDKRFHCFGCGADGDVIDFTAKLFGLPPVEAAEKLARDFVISHAGSTPGQRRGKRIARQAQIRKLRFDEAEYRFFLALRRKYFTMLHIFETRGPKKPGDPLDNAWCEAARDLPRVEALFDEYLAAGQEKRMKLMNQHRNEVIKFDISRSDRLG